MLTEYRGKIDAALLTWPKDRKFTLRKLLGKDWLADDAKADQLEIEFLAAIGTLFPQIEALGVNGRDHQRYKFR